MLGGLLKSSTEPKLLGATAFVLLRTINVPSCSTPPVAVKLLFGEVVSPSSSVTVTLVMLGLSGGLVSGGVSPTFFTSTLKDALSSPLVVPKSGVLSEFANGKS